jgi:hypothetical protein
VLHFQIGSALVLPRLIGGRQRGPLFLADRPPVPSRAPASESQTHQTIHVNARAYFDAPAAALRFAIEGRNLFRNLART